ncbi:hypothetical protein [Streptomyces sp. NPDC058773]|uniref:hypothetical protein n=1 Tax=Streptomyces sp. NPDC058773 TaxID=3346632 RepID=UPI003678A3BE
MPELRCEAVRWVDDEPFPGIVEVQFVDATGHRWSLFDKTPVFWPAVLTPEAVYPVQVTVACTILDGARQPAGDELVAVCLAPDGLTTPDGRDTFTVSRGRLIP